MKKEEDTAIRERPSKFVPCRIARAPRGRRAEVQSKQDVVLPEVKDSDGAVC